MHYLPHLVTFGSIRYMTDSRAMTRSKVGHLRIRFFIVSALLLLRHGFIVGTLLFSRKNGRTCWDGRTNNCKLAVRMNNYVIHISGVNVNGGVTVH